MLCREIIRCLFWHPYKTRKYTTWADCGIFGCVHRIANSDC